MHFMMVSEAFNNQLQIDTHLHEFTSIIDMYREIVMTKHHPEFDATEISLSNGMRVCYKCTDFLHNEVFLSTL